FTRTPDVAANPCTEAQGVGCGEPGKSGVGIRRRRPLMRPRTTLLGVTFASSLHSFGMQTSEFWPRGAGALGGIKSRLGLSLEVGHDVAGDQFEALGGRLRGRPIVAEQQIATEAAI